MPKCPKCLVTKRRDRFVKSANTKTGLGFWCLKCHKGYTAQWRAANPDKVKARNEINKHKRKSSYRNKYGITIREYDCMAAAQAGGCAVCEKRYPEERRLDVDHCHSTGKVRGPLCRGCNTAIGKLKDSQALLQRAIDYLDGRPLPFKGKV